MSIRYKSNTIIEGNLTVGQTSDGTLPLDVTGNTILRGDLSTSTENNYFNVNQSENADFRI